MKAKVIRGTNTAAAFKTNFFVSNSDFIIFVVFLISSVVETTRLIFLGYVVFSPNESVL